MFGMHGNGLNRKVSPKLPCVYPYYRIYIFGGIGELSIILCPLIKGVKAQKVSSVDLNIIKKIKDKSHRYEILERNELTLLIECVKRKRDEKVLRIGTADLHNLINKI